MSSIRRRILVGVLIVCLAAWFGLLGLERSYQPRENYDLIEERLYLGGQVKRPPPGTNALLNLCETVDPYTCETIVWDPIPDAEPAPDLDWLRRMVHWVDDQLRAGRTVYVHCRNGVSRSGMVVTAYVMFKRQWTRDRALAFVREKRPIVRPNLAFMERLAEWERVLQLPQDAHQQ
jgi:hypothetical protein